MPGLDKQIMMKDMSKKLEGCPYIFFAKFKGLPVNEFWQLRRSLEKVSRGCFVAKKTLLRRAFPAVRKGNGLMEGSIVLVTAEKDPQVVSKLLVEFAKDKESFQLAGACVEGKILDLAFVKELSKLPSRIELLAKVVGGIKSPITGFVLNLSGLVSSFVRVLDQVGKKKSS